MAIKAKYATKEQIPAGLQNDYVEKNGEFVLQTEGAPEGYEPKARVDEFRTNNIKLDKENTDLKKKFEGLDPDEYKTLKARADELDNGELLKKGNIQAITDKAVKAATEPLTRQIAEYKTRENTLQEKLSEVLIDSALRAAATEAGVHKHGLKDAVTRGKELFRLNEKNEPTAVRGDQPEYGEDGKPLTMQEFFAKRLTVEAPHLYPASGGSGAPNSSGGVGTVTTNPFKKEHFNLTQQGLLIRSNPREARRLASEAGVKLPGV